MSTILEKSQDASGDWVVLVENSDQSIQNFFFRNDPTQQIVDLASEAFVIAKQIDSLHNDLVLKNQELTDAIANQV